MFQKYRSIMNSGSVFGYFLQALPVAVLVGILYFIIRIALLKKRKIRSIGCQRCFVCCSSAT